jgi:hypothetical protein
MENPISDDLVALLSERVTSLEQIEVLLRLRAQPTVASALDEIVAQLPLPPDAVDDALAALVEQRLLVRDEAAGWPRWRYRSETPELERVIASLAEVYRERTLEVMRILSAQALDRIRNSAARAFADSFVIGRRKGG